MYMRIYNLSYRSYNSMDNSHLGHNCKVSNLASGNSHLNGQMNYTIDENVVFFHQAAS